jgi:uncharacterized membrane protein
MSSLFYRDPADPRVFIPREHGGLGLNFGHGIAWAIFLSMTVVPLVVVIGVTIALLL